MSSPALLDAEREPRIEHPEPMETDEALYELVNGQRVEMPPMSIRAVIVVSRLVSELNAFAKSQGLGEAFTEMLFHLPLAEDRSRNRRPDILYLSYNRWPVESPEDPDANAWEAIPDLAVEVISPSERADEQRGKVLEYFRVGVGGSGWSIPSSV
jgi:Uma2 family endonuclease